MRKNYVKPALISEEFVPQTYVAACEHTESGAGWYKFVCDAGSGERGDIITDEGINLTKNGFLNNYYHACNEAHEAPTTDEFEYGYFYKNGGNDRTTGYEKVRVIIWTGDGDVHATENLNQDTWEKNIS